MRTILLCVAGVVACLITSCGGPAAPTPAPTPPAAPTTSAAPQAIGPADIPDLQARWWTWAASSPTPTNPVSDRTGAHCAEHQQADLWLVAGSFGEVVSRRCTVPAGVPLAGPVVNLVSDGPGCAAFMGPATGQVLLDGEHQAVVRLGPAPVTFAAVAGNPVVDGSGRFDGVACGLWFALPPLSPGGHTLKITGSSGAFALDVTVELAVAART
jgi:hypothetical protein